MTDTPPLPFLDPIAVCSLTSYHSCRLFEKQSRARMVTRGGSFNPQSDPGRRTGASTKPITSHARVDSAPNQVTVDSDAHEDPAA